MQEQIISFDTAKLAKEKGFPVNISRDYYLNDGDKKMMTDVNYLKYHRNDDLDKLLPAPTQSLLQKWLREEHNIYVIPYIKDGYCYYKIKKEYVIDIDYNKGYVKHFEEWEQALESGLQEALKLIELC